MTYLNEAPSEGLFSSLKPHAHVNKVVCFTVNLRYEGYLLFFFHLSVTI